MHHSWIRPPGHFIGATPFNPSDLENLGRMLYGAVNADDGGTWNPSTPIVVGGVGMQVSGPLSVTNVTDARWGTGGGAQFNSGSTCRVGSGALAEVQAGGVLEVESGGKLEVESGGELEVQAGGGVEVQSGGTVFVRSGGQAAFEAGSVTVFANGASLAVGSSGLSTTGPLARSSLLGAAAKIEQRQTTFTDTSASASTDYDLVVMNVPGATLRTLTLRTTSAPVPERGDIISVRKDGSGAGGCQVQNEGSANLLVTWSGAAKGQAKFVFDGAKWRLLGEYGASSIGLDAA